MECPLCWETPHLPMIAVPCGHGGCLFCVHPYAHRDTRCMMCRQEVDFYMPNRMVSWPGVLTEEEQDTFDCLSAFEFYDYGSDDDEEEGDVDLTYASDEAEGEDEEPEEDPEEDPATPTEPAP